MTASGPTGAIGARADDDTVEVTEYMKQLAEVSPSDIANIDLEGWIHYYISGQVGLI